MFLPTVHKTVFFSMSSLTLVIFCLPDSHSNRYEMMLHCGFDLPLPDELVRLYALSHSSASRVKGMCEPFAMCEPFVLIMYKASELGREIPSECFSSYEIYAVRD